MPRGSKPGERRGGRAKGTKNKGTLEVEDLLKSLDCDPIEGLARIANGEPLLCRAYLGNEDIEVRPTFDQRLTAYKELAQYVAPKRKAIDHSGSIAIHEERLEDLDDLDDAE